MPFEAALRDVLGAVDENLLKEIIVTPKGVCTVCYRNSSNGYYGGWLESAATDEGPKGERLAGDWVHPPAEREGG